MSDISDPSRPGRGDRKRAQKVIDAAYAAGQISATDRTHRTQRIESAYTKGDLAVIVRDLNRAGPAASAAAGGAVTAPTASTDPTPAQAGTPSGQASLGSAIPKDQFDALLTGASPRATKLAESVRTSVATGGGVRKVRRVFLIVLIGFLLLCGFSVAGMVGAIFTAIDDVIDSGISLGSGDATAAPTPSLNLQTAAGWTEMVAAVEEETGSSRVYDAVVYPDYASVNAVVDDGAKRYVYRNGSFQLFNSPVTAAATKPVDLADIDPAVVERLADRTAKRQKMPDYESAYLIVNTWSGEPSIMVYVQQTGRLSRWSIFDFKGKVVGGTP